MFSMTGYGRGEAQNGGKSIVIELKTVNHRYLDWNPKLPKGFLFLEDALKKRLSSKISRGHVDLYLTCEQTASSSDKFVPDFGLAQNYASSAKNLSEALGLENDLTLTALLKVPDVLVRTSAGEDPDALSALALSALDQALDGLTAMRAKEGESLSEDIASKLTNIEESLKIIAAKAPKVVTDYRGRLNARIKEVLNETPVDLARLATEVVLYADRCAIDEEISRLTAHIANMRALLNCDEPSGRKLDFLVQELNRETNTIGSKANDSEITEEVLKIKNEIEKIREQAQNVE